MFGGMGAPTKNKGGNPLIITYEKRIRQLVEKDGKSKTDLNEIKFLQEQLAIHYDAIAKYEKAKRDQPDPGSGKGKTASATRGKTRSRKNEVAEVMEKLEGSPLSDLKKKKWKFLDNSPLLGYQLGPIANSYRWQWYLKPRQIGFTLGMAYKMWRLMLKGESCTWISASKPQAFVARDYIKRFAHEECGLELNGVDEIILYKDGQIHAKGMFRGANKATGQSYSGHLFIDEIFWLPDFVNVERAARGIATQKKYMKIYFSTPSWVTHGAYHMWRGDPDKDLISGKVQDGIYREIISLEQAVKDGAGSFIDIAQLRDENDDESYRQLFGNQFLDDQLSIFKFAKLRDCLVEALDWDDFEMNSNEQRIYTGDGVVWGGFDPAPRRDWAKFILMTKPDDKHKEYRKILEMEWKDVHFRQMAEDIVECVSEYNIEHLVVDRNGAGEGVCQILEEALPHVVTGLIPTQAEKSKMVTTATDLINDKKMLFHINDYHIPNAFTQIKTGANRDGSRTLIKTDRNKRTGNHGDIAWAAMNAVYFHELARTRGSSFGFVN